MSMTTEMLGRQVEAILERVPGNTEELRQYLRQELGEMREFAEYAGLSESEAAAKMIGFEVDNLESVHRQLASAVDDAETAMAECRHLQVRLLLVAARLGLIGSLEVSATERLAAKEGA